MKIAVVGSGISGLSAAYYLSKKFKVDLFEQEDYFGGHSFTFDIKKENKIIPVDLGFIVFNELTYPNLINFFNDLQVPFEKSDMSFSVSVKDTPVEYAGKNLNTIFANRLNIFNFKFLKMIKEIYFFYRKAPLLVNRNYTNETLGSFLKMSKLSKYFIDYHLIPMVAAIWSMPFDKAKEMPLVLFLNFFNNHGLFKLRNRPQWYTVTNRSRTYVNKVLSKISGEIYKNYRINKIFRDKENIRLVIGGEYLNYDHVILATHADQSLNLIDNPTQDEIDVLSKFTYVNNIAYLHTDNDLMPNRKDAWSSWNVIAKGEKTCVTYWLNKLQNLSLDTNYFLTLNPVSKIKKEHIIKSVHFTHPYFNSENISKQKDLALLQGNKRTWFCGSYFGYGFHEDGLKSSLNLKTIFKGK